jgi:ribose transport system substrate-binding protein
VSIGFSPSLPVIAFARRQELLRLLQEQPGLRVPQLAAALGVSEGTIRNDLDALEQEARVRRVRGGAVPVAAGTADFVRAANGGRQGQADDEASALRFMGRWAADMVEDGDTILLDASPAAQALVPFLADHRHLTVVTNGLETARLLAGNPSNTVVLIGGIVRVDTVAASGATIGLLGAQILADLHIRLAFVSGAGFTVEAGLMDDNLQEAQLKRQMLESAGYAVALVDASRLGRKGLTPSVGVERLHQLFVDTGVAPEQLEQLRQLPLNLTVCGENTVTNYAPDRHHATYKIGFANLSEEIPFAVDVRRGLERAAKQLSNIDLVVADNRLDGARALQIVDNFIGKGVDLAIEYQLDARYGTVIMDKYQRAGIPVIAVDIPMVGATYFGVNNFQSGYLAGVALGRWIRENWAGEFDRLLVLEEPRAGALPEARMVGQLQGLAEVAGPVPDAKKIVLNSGNTSTASEAEMHRTLLDLPHEHRIAVVSFNDDAALGALRAARQLGRENDLAIVGQGADRLIRDELRRPDARVVGSTAFLPERYGEKLMELAARILRGESVPPAVYMDHVFVDAANVARLYPAA